MENIFLNIIQNLSDSRFWLGPLLLFCVCIIAGITGLEAMGINFKKIKEIDIAAIALFIFCIAAQSAIVLSWILNRV